MGGRAQTLGPTDSSSLLVRFNSDKLEGMVAVGRLHENNLVPDDLAQFAPPWQNDETGVKKEESGSILDNLD